ncbi:hypothetical protein BSL82_03840 [Tardibacter chloracetimidivorans]|uniref:Uncharacterized protein n=1 Tax=Tardibacter chloracetimidivorans TaxID=1921510 RepID=A0A1L3ZSG0_9SPHN|nr:hypothetical protein [Tardibacter chloracetimidivorans]API58549.1 hypothetical protein BSL82_03840 [Tardibacter chloracetimidivorans]
MISFLTPKIGAGLAVIATAASVFAWVQSARLTAANDRIVSRDREMTTMQQQLNVQATALAQKDAVIRQQTTGLDMILKARWQDRQAYTANLSAADGRAKSLTAQADRLIALKVPQGDEVDQCRAARELLEKELME